MRTHARPGEQGFSLVEMLFVITISSVVMAMAMLVSPVYTRFARAEAGTTQALDILRAARDAAITQRRNVQVIFVGTNAIQIARVEIPGGSTTVLRSMTFEGRMQFLLQGVGDTPDAFCASPCTAVKFGTGSTSSLTRMFTSEGTFVDANGDVLNGSVFISLPGDVSSARAITFFGANALLRVWKWSGTAWIQ